MTDDDDQYHNDISWTQRNIWKLIIVSFLLITTIASSVALAVILIKQSQRHQALIEKKNVWSNRLKEFQPILNSLTPIIFNVIKVAMAIILL